MFVYAHQKQEYSNMHALGLLHLCVVWLQPQPTRVGFTVDVSFLIVVSGKTRSGKENRLRSSSQFPIPRRDDQVSGYLRNEIY